MQYTVDIINYLNKINFIMRAVGKFKEGIIYKKTLSLNL